MRRSWLCDVLRSSFRGPIIVLLTCLLRVLGQTPANDNMANAFPLTGTNATASGSTIEATHETGEPNHVGGNGQHSVWWKWTAPGTGTVLLNLTNSASGSVAAVYLGKYVNALSVVSSNAAGNLDGTARLRFRTQASESYQIAVDTTGTPGAVALSLQWSEKDLPPEITSQPGDTEVVDRGGVAFNVVASSGTPVSYQWRFNGALVAGATNQTLTWSLVRLDQAG